MKKKRDRMMNPKQRANMTQRRSRRKYPLHNTTFFFYALFFVVVLQAVLSIFQGNILESETNHRNLRVATVANLFNQDVANVENQQITAKSGDDKVKGHEKWTAVQHKKAGTPSSVDTVIKAETIQRNTTTVTDTQSLKNTIKSRSRLPLLVIGGSDGSGTRAFVDVLGHLRVPMLVDDTATLDIHAPCFYSGDGWPHVVNKVLSETHSANYEFSDLQETTQDELREQMRICFREHYAPRAMRLLREASSHGTELPNEIRYGFKAPVSMLLLPVLLETFGSIKFLHVIRDGRDIALSTNTSPVDKFYQTFYPNAAEQEKMLQTTTLDSVQVKQVMAMQLWNDWNTQVYEFGTTHPSIDYLPVKTEDLLSPDTRFEAILQIAEFVGSPLSVEDICCLSQRELRDMGKSMTGPGGTYNRPDVRKQLKEKSVVSSFLDRQDKEKIQLTSELELLKHQGTRLRKQMEASYDAEDTLLERNEYEKKLQEHRQEILNHIPNEQARNKFRQLVMAPKEISVDTATPDEVKQRYGKWVSKLEHFPQLSSKLHFYGSKGLDLFGYEPTHEFLSRKFSSEQCSVCAE